jgi:hypothetical protein
MAENDPAGGLAAYRQFVEQQASDFPTQYRQAQENIQQSLEQGRAANSALMEFLNSQRGTGPSPLLQLASGLLRPTRAGGFGESLAAGAEGYAGALQQQRQSELDRAMRIQQLQAATANLGMQAAQQRAALTGQALQFPTQLAAAQGAMADLNFNSMLESRRLPTRPAQMPPGAPMPSASPIGPQPQISATPLTPPAAAAPAAPAAAAPAAPLDLDEGVNTETMGPPGTQEISEDARRVEETLARLASEQRERLQAEQAAAAPAPGAPTPAPGTPTPALGAPTPSAAAPAPIPAETRSAAPPAPTPFVRSSPLGLALNEAEDLYRQNPRSAAARADFERSLQRYQASPEGRAEIKEAEERAQARVRREGANDEEFDRTAAREQAQNFTEMSKGIADGSRMLSNLRVLETMAADLPSGILGFFSEQGARLGIGSQAPQYEVARALLNQLIPGQRQGMPGAVSDRDVQMFRDSLPRLMSSPEGRQMTIDTLKAVAEDQVVRGRIAQDALNGRVPRREAEGMMDELPSPFTRFIEYQRQAGRDPAGRPLPAAPGGAQAPAPAPGVTNDDLNRELRRRGLIQ